MDQRTQGFIQGLAYSAAWIIKNYDQPMMALDMLQSSGYTYADLLRAKCASDDLRPIAKELGLRVDGKPRKVAVATK